MKGKWTQVTSPIDVNGLVYQKRRRLQKLKEQEARQGINTDPAILIEIEDLEEEIRGLQTDGRSPSRDMERTRFVPETPDFKPAYVTILLDRDIKIFGSTEREALVEAVSRIAYCDPTQIRILRVEAGSVVVTLEMPDWAARRLYSASLGGTPEFRSLSILSVNLNGDYVPDVELVSTTQPSAAAKPEPVKILFLAANPRDTDRLRLDEEVRSIDEAISRSDFRNAFEIRQQWAVRIDDLQYALLRHRPNIVHFSGHGSSSSGIVLEDAQGYSRPVSTQALADLFEIFKDDVQCVFLDACYSAEQAIAISRSIDGVVGVTDQIGDRAAIVFVKAFYQALAFGKDLQTAFELGRVQIELSGLSENNPVKLIASNVDPKKIAFVGSR